VLPLNLGLMLTPDQTVALAERVLAARYPKAACGFATGSLVRGDGTEGSDLDLVVLYDALPNARREALAFEGTPVETFVHDPETLAWTFRDEAKVGRCAVSHHGRSRPPHRAAAGRGEAAEAPGLEFACAGSRRARHRAP
jgi:Nucleotidyltransferase domain